MAKLPDDQNMSHPKKTVVYRFSRAVQIFAVICFIFGVTVIAKFASNSSVKTAVSEVLPTPTTLPAQAEQEPHRCITVVGDSVAFGIVLFGLPSGEVYSIRLNPLSTYLKRSLSNIGISDVEIRDRNLIGIALGPGVKEGRESYFGTNVYKSALADHCAVTILMPWLNDLTPTKLSAEEAAVDYVKQLGSLAWSIETANPKGKILVLDYYPGKPQDFVKPIAGGFTPEHIGLYNTQIQSACSGGNPTLSRSECLHTVDAFAGMADTYLTAPMTRSQIEADLAPEATLDRATDYFGQNPDGLLIGDGEHLSPSGKAALADFLVKHISKYLSLQ